MILYLFYQIFSTNFTSLNFFCKHVVKFSNLCVQQPGQIDVTIFYQPNSTIPTNAMISWNWGDNTASLEESLLSYIMSPNFASRSHVYLQDGNYITNITIYNNVSTEVFILPVSRLDMCNFQHGF